MEFSMKGGGVSSRSIKVFKKKCLKTIQNHSLTAKTCFAHSKYTYMVIFYN